MKVGLSLSFCVRDILEGKVKLEDVEVIISGTTCSTVDEYMDVVENYAKNYWMKNPEQGKWLAFVLWDTKRIAQPKLEHAKDELDFQFIEMPRWHRNLRACGTLWLEVVRS